MCFHRLFVSAGQAPTELPRSYQGPPDYDHRLLSRFQTYYGVHEPLAQRHAHRVYGWTRWLGQIQHQRTHTRRKRTVAILTARQIARSNAIPYAILNCFPVGFTFHYHEVKQNKMKKKRKLHRLCSSRNNFLKFRSKMILRAVNKCPHESHSRLRLLCMTGVTGSYRYS